MGTKRKKDIEIPWSDVEEDREMKHEEIVPKQRTATSRSCCSVQSMLAFHNRMYEIGKLQQAARDKGRRSSLPEQCR